MENQQPPPTSTAESEKTSPSETLKLMLATIHAAGERPAEMSKTGIESKYADVLAKRSAPDPVAGETLLKSRGLSRDDLLPVPTHRRALRRMRRDGQIDIDEAAMSDRQILDHLASMTAAEKQQAEQERDVDRRQRIEDLFRVSRAPALHTDHLDLIDESENPRFIQLRDELVAHLTDRGGYLVALLGHRGPGKTQMAVSVIHRNCLALRLSLYFLLPKFFSEIKAGFSGQRDPSIQSEAQIIDRLCRPHLLVLDECHQRAETQWEQDKLVQVIVRRYDDRKCTIMIANQTRDEFSAAMGDSIISRMRERGWAFEFDWPSYRQQCAWQPFAEG